MKRRVLILITGLALIGASLPSAAISVQDYFSIQEQASVQNVEQRQARNALNGVHAGLYDAFSAMLLAGDGKLYTESGALICMDSSSNFRIQTVRELLVSAIGTYERPALSSNALEEFPLGVHLLKEMAEQYPCR
ncbi:hypothetical protein [Marinobacter sp.]|uniref:hypothetical protein n=1 Tax=Marinobacter sp. TaxID=50741 RepID=UPI003569C274